MFGCSHCATSWVNQHGWQFPMEMVNPRHAELLPFCFTIHRRFTCYRFVSPFTLWRVYCGIVSFRFVLTFKIVKHSIQLIWRVCETGGSTCTCTTRTYRLPNLIFFGKAVVVLRRVLLYQHGHFKCIYIYICDSIWIVCIIHIIADGLWSNRTIQTSRVKVLPWRTEN